MVQLKILGIESSCDDTAAAVVDSQLGILSNIVISQNQEHRDFNGVVPEIAARSHMANLEKAISLALSDANLSLNEIDAIAATSGPGLIGGVIVGTMFGKAIATVLDKPFIAINHLEGHALTCKLTNNVEYPYLLLLVSGGHCQFIAVEGLGKYKILGSTIDDAVGEAFDKVAKMLGLEFPGGPKIEQYAVNGDPFRFNFPRPLFEQKNCDMSFSGLKTAVRLEIQKLGAFTKRDICDVAASFQRVVAEILIKKTTIAIEKYEQICSGKTLVVSGGVAANILIRQKLQQLSTNIGYNFVAPPIKLCTDNAVMIAFAGLERLKAGMISGIHFKPRARWSLEDISQSS